MRNHGVLGTGDPEPSDGEEPTRPGQLRPHDDPHPQEFIDRGQPPAEWGPPDEFGLPKAWRRDTPLLIGDVEESWRLFERWATARGFKAFPADIVPVALFLAERPVSGVLLRRVWEAIDLYHFRLYWHEAADPVLQLQLGFGVHVSSEGVVTVEGVVPSPPDD